MPPACYYGDTMMLEDMIKDRITLLEALRRTSFTERDPQYTNKQLDAAIAELRWALEVVGNYA